MQLTLPNEVGSTGVTEENMESYYANIIYTTSLVFIIGFVSFNFIDRAKSNKEQIYSALLKSPEPKTIHFIFIILLLVIAGVAAVGILFLNLQSGIDGDGNPVYFEPNKFGDFFGGTLGPILSFLSFISLLWTIYTQDKFSKNSIEIQEKQLRISMDQRNEESFFLLLGRFHEIRSQRGISLVDKSLREASARYVAVRQFDENPDAILNLIASHSREAAREIEIQYKLFCRIVGFIDDSPRPSRKRMIPTLLSFIREEDSYIFQALAATQKFDDGNVYGLIYRMGLLRRFGDNPPPYIVYIRQLHENQRSKLFHEKLKSAI